MPTVLIADDEEGIRHLIARALKREGFTVETVPDGKAAIDLLRREHFDVLVLDLMMPHIDGYGVLSYLEAHDAHFIQKTVVVTAVAATAERRPLEEVCKVLHKPFELPELLDAVRDCAAM